MNWLRSRNRRNNDYESKHVHQEKAQMSGVFYVSQDNTLFDCKKQKHIKTREIQKKIEDNFRNSKD